LVPGKGEVGWGIEWRATWGSRLHELKSDYDYVGIFGTYPLRTLDAHHAYLDHHRSGTGRDNGATAKRVLKALIAKNSSVQNLDFYGEQSTLISRENNKKGLSMTIVITKPSEDAIKEDIQAMRKASDKLLTSKKTAREYLVRHGYITKSGKLTKTYSK
jgi:hypothetical protein